MLSQAIRGFGTGISAVAVVSLCSVTDVAAADCPTVYQNDNYLNIVMAYGSNVEMLDDLHTTLPAPSSLCAFEFRHRSFSGVVDASVSFYANDAADSPPGALLAGPYLFPNLPTGSPSIVVHFDVPPGVMINPNVWIGFTYNGEIAGVGVADPPSVGSSHDRMYKWPPGEYQNDANVVDNLWVRLFAETPTPAHPVTWGSLKASYR